MLLVLGINNRVLCWETFGRRHEVVKVESIARRSKSLAYLMGNLDSRFGIEYFAVLHGDLLHALFNEIQHVGRRNSTWA
jgi:hypothetical protein